MWWPWEVGKQQQGWAVGRGLSLEFVVLPPLPVVPAVSIILGPVLTSQMLYTGKLTQLYSFSMCWLVCGGSGGDRASGRRAGTSHLHTLLTVALAPSILIVTVTCNINIATIIACLAIVDGKLKKYDGSHTHLPCTLLSDVTMVNNPPVCC